ncbi:MAG: hypothetical protein ACFB03_12290 [Paracoccaceae bacterium]
MRWLVSLFAAVLGLSAVSAAEFKHCCPENPPKDAIEDAERARVLAFGYVYIPVVIRRFCGLTDATDWSYVDWITLEAGCALDSPLGVLNRGLLTRDEDEIEGVQGATYFKAKCPELYAVGCGIISRLPSISAASGTPMASRDEQQQYNLVMNEYTDWQRSSAEHAKHCQVEYRR